MCGIIGISQHKDAAQLAYSGLYALQHRGEEAAGIATYDGKNIHIKKEPGLVADAFDERSMAALKGDSAIGHCRYSTTGSSNLKNIQPFMVTHKNTPIAIAHNGNLTNTELLYRRLEEEGSIFQTTMDSEIIIHLLARQRNGSIEDAFVKVLAQLEGAYSLVFLVENTVVGARDPRGFRPLCLGTIDGTYLLSSESCSLDLIGASFVREIEPGEIVFINGEKIRSVYLPGRETVKKSHCIFENIYFSRPDSDIFDDNIYQVR
ncbi:MAG: class II glutamine amidotransferase, partial [Leptospiraceae bacterium]|nr:class II glutamine amidotransferase [Leptospiraceae bacterium]